MTSPRCDTWKETLKHMTCIYTYLSCVPLPFCARLSCQFLSAFQHLSLVSVPSEWSLLVFWSRLLSCAFSTSALWLGFSGSDPWTEQTASELSFTSLRLFESNLSDHNNYYVIFWFWLIKELKLVLFVKTLSRCSLQQRQKPVCLCISAYFITYVHTNTTIPIAQ